MTLTKFIKVNNIIRLNNYKKKLFYEKKKYVPVTQLK